MQPRREFLKNIAIGSTILGGAAFVGTVQGQRATALSPNDSSQYDYTVTYSGSAYEAKDASGLVMFSESELGALLNDIDRASVAPSITSLLIKDCRGPWTTSYTPGLGKGFAWQGTGKCSPRARYGTFLNYTGTGSPIDCSAYWGAPLTNPAQVAYLQDLTIQAANTSDIPLKLGLNSGRGANGSYLKNVALVGNMANPTLAPFAVNVPTISQQFKHTWVNTEIAGFDGAAKFRTQHLFFQGAIGMIRNYGILVEEGDDFEFHLHHNQNNLPMNNPTILDTRPSTRSTLWAYLVLENTPNKEGYRSTNGASYWIHKTGMSGSEMQSQLLTNTQIVQAQRPISVVSRLE